VNAVRPGSIVLLHDGGGDRSQTVKALPEIVRGIRAKGLKLVLLEPRRW
jgi:peptidoglycan-N-acetylglucosamine deacetylase